MRHGAGYLLTREMMIWFWNNYLKDRQMADHPVVSPLRADDLHSLPGALILTAEFGPLRDEGEAYAKRLQQAGVPVILKRYHGMIHGISG